MVQLDPVRGRRSGSRQRVNSSLIPTVGVSSYLNGDGCPFVRCTGGTTDRRPPLGLPFKSGQIHEMIGYATTIASDVVMRRRDLHLVQTHKPRPHRQLFPVCGLRLPFFVVHLHLYQTGADLSFPSPPAAEPPTADGGSDAWTSASDLPILLVVPKGIGIVP